MSQIAKKWIQDNAIDNDKIDNSVQYTINGLISNANVGVGTTTPLSDLHVAGDTTANIRVQRLTDADGLLLGIGAGLGYINTLDSVNFTLQTEGTNRVYVASSTGNVGIGTSDPQGLLHVMGDVVGSSDNSSNLGSAARRWATVYMASNVDYANDLVFSSSGEKIRFTTGGNVGIGTIDPQGSIHVESDAGKVLIRRAANTDSVELGMSGAGAAFLNASSGVDTQFQADGTANVYLKSDGKVGIGTSPVVGAFEVAGAALLHGDLTVNGTTTTINTETTTTDKMSIIQDGDQVALEVNKTSTGTGTAVVITNAGLSPAMSVMADGTGNGNVGIGTTNPGYPVDIKGTGIPLRSKTAASHGIAAYLIYEPAGAGLNGEGATIAFDGKSTTTNSRTMGEIGYKWTDATHADRTSKFFVTTVENAGADTEKLTVLGNGNVGIGTTNPLTNLHVNDSGAGVEVRLTKNSETYGARLLSNSTAFYVTHYQNLPLIFETNNTGRMIIAGNGNVGIGTNNPGDLLTLRGPDGGDARVSLTSKSASAASFEQIFSVGNTGSSVNDGFLKLYDSGTAKVNIAANNSRGGDTYFNGGGNVGIGTNNPSNLVDIRSKGDSTYPLMIKSSSDNNMIGLYQQGTGNGQIDMWDNAGNRDILFTTESGQPSYINNGGNVGIGTTNPQDNIHVQGGCRVTDLAGTGNRLVYSTGTGGLTNSSSDITLKENITTIEGCLNKTIQLNPVSFNWKDTEKLGKQTEIGLIAQEVEKVVPEVIGKNSDNTLSLDYPKLVAVLIGSVKELSAKNGALEERIKNLESA